MLLSQFQINEMYFGENAEKMQMKIQLIQKHNAPWIPITFQSWMVMVFIDTENKMEAGLKTSPKNCFLNIHLKGTVIL